MKKKSVKLLIYSPEVHDIEAGEPEIFSIQSFFDAVVPSKTTSMRKDEFLTVKL